MKTRKILTSVLLLLLLVCGSSINAGAAQSASVLLQEGLYAEEIEGDLDAAIKIYERIVAQGEQTEQAAAMAMYRIGMCRLKKGDKAEAAGQFQEVIKKYPGQKALVAKARSQITKIQPALTAVFRPVVESSNDGQTYFYDFDKEKVFPRPEWLTRDSPRKEAETWFRKNGIDFIIGDNGHIELGEMTAVKVVYGLWDSAGAAEVNAALDKGPHETISLSVSEEGLKISGPLTYVFETREGGKGMLQILGKKGGNVSLRYKMLSDAAVATTQKVNVYEYLPAEIIQHIGGAYGSICAKAAAKNLYSNSHIYFVTPDWVLLKAGMGYHLNSTGRAITGRIRLSGTSNPNQTLYDIAGREMNAEIVPDKVRKKFYHIYWTPSEPLSPWQMFYYGWSVDVSTPLHPEMGSGNYSLRMHNKFGNRCIETFFLVVPEGTRLVSKTEDFTVKNTVADFDIYYWSKELLPSTSNTVDVKLAPSSGHAEFGGDVVAMFWDIDHPKTKGRHCTIDLDKNITAKIPAEKLQSSGTDMMRYLAGEGIDAVGEFAQNKASLIALGMVVEVKAADAWDSMTAAELQSSLGGKSIGAVETTIMPWNEKGEQPVFAFKTREGAIGLLQIVSADEKAQKFEVRYKKVKNMSTVAGAAAERAVRRRDSTHRLRDFGIHLLMYANDQKGVLPDNPEKLKPYVQDVELLGWVRANVEYVGGGEKLSNVAKPQAFVLAYDKTLMGRDAGTNVLFLDTHVEFVGAGELKKYGIAGTGASTGVAASPHVAADMLPALKGLMVGVAEAIEKDDTDTALELLDELIVEAKKVALSMKGTSTESAVTAGVRSLEMLREALANKQTDKVETLLEVLNQMGPGLEEAVEEEAAKRRKPYGAPGVE